MTTTSIVTSNVEDQVHIVPALTTGAVGFGVTPQRDIDSLSSSNNTSYYLTRTMSTSATIKVESLPYFCDAQQLTDHFDRYGRVKDIHILREKESQKKIATVTFENACIARSMIRMFNGHWFYGRKLVISDNELDSRFASVDSFDLPATPRSYSNGFRVQIAFQSQYKSSNNADFIQPTEVFFLRTFLKYGMINDVVIHQYQYNPGYQFGSATIFFEADEDATALHTNCTSICEQGMTIRCYATNHTLTANRTLSLSMSASTDTPSSGVPLSLNSHSISAASPSSPPTPPIPPLSRQPSNVNNNVQRSNLPPLPLGPRRGSSSTIAAASASPAVVALSTQSISPLVSPSGAASATFMSMFHEAFQGGQPTTTTAPNTSSNTVPPHNLSSNGSFYLPNRLQGESVILSNSPPSNKTSSSGSPSSPYRSLNSNQVRIASPSMPAYPTQLQPSLQLQYQVGGRRTPSPKNVKDLMLSTSDSPTTTVGTCSTSCATVSLTTVVNALDDLSVPSTTTSCTSGEIETISLQNSQTDAELCSPSVSREDNDLAIAKAIASANSVGVM